MEDLSADRAGFRSKRADRTEALFKYIVARAIATGMKMNTAKTSTMCISTARGYLANAYMLDEDGKKIKPKSTVNRSRVITEVKHLELNQSSEG